MTTDVDVLIVGSGPAGCSTALHLAKFAPALAQRCVVLEKSSHPRHKLCGGGLVVDVDTILHNLGLDLNDVPHVDATWAHLNFQGRGTRTRPHGDIAFHVVRRREFDHWLADRVRDTGVPIHEHTEVLALDRRPDHVVVETSRGTFRARAVIGADGTKGMVRRKITGDSGAMARLLEVMIPPPASGDVPPDEAVFDFRHIPHGVQGYYWSFPMVIEGRAMRNLGIYDSRVVDDAPLSGSLKRYLEQELAAQGVALADCKLEGHPIHLYSQRSVMSAPHILLVGDAAGADPLLGEGISPALGYGELAARALIDAFASGDLEFHDYTRRVHRSPLGRSLRRRLLTARLVYGMTRPAVHRFMWWHMRPFVHHFIREFVFGWARPGEPSRLPAGAVPTLQPQPHH
jgi:flavin-dependent dehydrogenase